MRHEYHDHLELNQEEKTLLENHSLLNLFNILELQLAGLCVELPDAGIQKHFQFCLDTLIELSRMNIRDRFPVLIANCQTLRSHLQELIENHPDSNKLLQGLITTTDIGHARLVEFNKPRSGWTATSKSTILDTLKVFLEATSKVSGDRFGFVFSPEPPRPKSYWIDFQIDFETDKIKIPATLNDTIRDLVSNARKYSEPGSTIRVKLTSVENGGLQLTVSDEGIGIPKDELPSIICYGYRATNAIDRRTMGGGLGVTKAYKLCRENNGKFIVESELGKGTTFITTFFPPSTA